MEPWHQPYSPRIQKTRATTCLSDQGHFLWNLHEALATPEEFAIGFVRDLDLPNPQAMTMTISNQIRQQLEEYAGVALHPLFQSTQTKPVPVNVSNTVTT